MLPVPRLLNAPSALPRSLLGRRLDQPHCQADRYCVPRPDLLRSAP